MSTDRINEAARECAKTIFRLDEESISAVIAVAMRKIVDKLEVECDLYVDLFEDYAAHNPGCSAACGDEYRCTCGYREALKEHQERHAVRTRPLTDQHPELEEES